MSLTVKNEGGDFTPCPAGNHLGICYGVIDLGTQKSDAFQWEGKLIPESTRPQLLLMWEIPTELIEIEGEMKPAVISKFYNAFWGERASLRIHLEAWRGRPFVGEEIAVFNVGNLLGKPCMINVLHTEAGKAKIAGIAAIPKGMAVPELMNDKILFDLGEFNQDTFDNLSEGIAKIVEKSPEYQAIMGPGPAEPTGFRDGSAGSGNEPPAFTDDDLNGAPF